MIAALVLASAAPAQGASGVSAYPSPGTHYNLPGTQITFRGVNPSQIGSVAVVGSVTGTHTGQIQADSDGRGASFVPDKPFAAGETVTVTTSMDVIGATNGSFSFAIARTAAAIQPMALPQVPAGSNGVQHFRSRPDLQPAAVSVTRNSTPGSEGDIFVAPQFGPSQDGPMILDPHGRLIWFLPYPVATKTLITDFRVQQLHGQPVLTWWQGYTNHGSGQGEGIIFDHSYRRIATVQAGNGLTMDLHEFLVTNSGQAWAIAVSPVTIPGISKPVMDGVVQEIDIKTGLVLFEWHALDHVALGDSYFNPKSPGFVYDPYHVNSVWPTGGGIVVSMRNTSAVYDIDPSTGNIEWELGGRRSSFKLGRGVATAFQHDAIMQPDGTLTIFDDGAGPPQVHKNARGIRVRLDTRHHTASLVREYDHSPQISTNFEGNVQQLTGGDVFMGWGQQPYFSEDNAAGQETFDAHFVAPTSSYRAYRFPWSAQPPTSPALAVAPGADGTTTVYASWNGATDVSAWRVLAGPSATGLNAVGSALDSGFETAIPVHSGDPYFAVQALGSSGQVLATSPVKGTPAHLALYGRSAFVSGSGTGGMPAGCLSAHACSISTTVSVGRTVIARTGREAVGANSGGLLFFTLTGAGRTMLDRAAGRQLRATVTARDESGTSATATINLIRFTTSGAGPHRSLSPASSLQLVGQTDFVSAKGTGGLLAACYATTPCHISAKLTAGSTTVATTGGEFVGAGELGYVIFSLTPAGRSMLAHAPGNQLGVAASIANGSVSAGGQLALVGF